MESEIRCGLCRSRVWHIEREQPRVDRREAQDDHEAPTGIFLFTLQADKDPVACQLCCQTAHKTQSALLPSGGPACNGSRSKSHAAG